MTEYPLVSQKDFHHHSPFIGQNEIRTKRSDSVLTDKKCEATKEENNQIVGKLEDNHKGDFDKDLRLELN